MTAQDLQLSRRAVMAGAAGLVIGIALPIGRALAQGAPSAANPPPISPNAFLRIGTDDSVTVFAKHLEMGQGPFTGLATLVAEELDADWAQMRSEHSAADVKLYANLNFGVQGTGGSTAIANSYIQMRRAGAMARALLVQAAAARWGVPAGEISVERGMVAHAKSGRKGRFGEFAEAAARLPMPADVTLKTPDQFTLIGKDHGVGRPDSAAKVNGTATFTLDINEPGMLTVLVARSPRFGGKVASYDPAAALKVPGVVAVRQLSSGVAVYANGMWAAKQGRDALTIAWDDSAAEKRGSEAIIADYRALAEKPGAIAGKKGDAAAALAGGGEVVEAEYVFPYLAHAPMEPLDGYIKWDGKKVLARFGSQFQTTDHSAMAKVFGVGQEAIRIDTMLAGGSFGRRAQTTSHFAIELAEAGKAIGPGKPVKLVWTREDDLHGGYYRPIYLHRLRGVIKDKKIVGWHNRIVGQSLMKGGIFEAFIKDGIDATSVEGSRELPYAVPHFACELHTTTLPVPVLWWRSVGHTHTGYAVECFIDELLQRTGQDPVAGRLALMKDQSRLAGVLKAVADFAEWKGPMVGNGRARGVAVVESFSSYVAQIAEVSVGDDGEPRVHKVWAAVDVGVAVNPDVIRAQVEGGIGYGLGHALYAEVPLEDGVPVASNFNNYRSLRINEMPEIAVTIVKSAEPPTGIGEPGVPPIAPAVANALAALGKKRPARLPMVRPA